MGNNLICKKCGKKIRNPKSNFQQYCDDCHNRNSASHIPDLKSGTIKQQAPQTEHHRSVAMMPAVLNISNKSIKPIRRKK